MTVGAFGVVAALGAIGALTDEKPATDINVIAASDAASASTILEAAAETPTTAAVAETTTAPETVPPETTVAPTTAVPVTVPPTTAAPVTVPPVTAPPPTAPPATAPPVTVVVPPPVPLVAAPPAPAGCHPSYLPCVPDGVEDVDCSGGKGNGPVYVDGPIQIVGSDPYGLDGNDNDGIGCG